MGLNSTAVAQNISNGNVYMKVQQMPSFIGNLNRYLAAHIKYPQSAIDRRVVGTVFVTFIVNRDGTLSDVKILDGVSPDLDSEAVRVVSQMPPWNPGRIKEAPVRVQFNLPVQFKIKGYSPRDTAFVKRDGIYLDPFCGYGIAGPQSSLSDLKSNISRKEGLGVSLFFPSGFGFSTGFSVQQVSFSFNPAIGTSNAVEYLPSTFSESFKDTLAYTGFNANVTYTFQYFQVPLLARYISSSENKIGFYAEVGFLINYLHSSSITGTASEFYEELSQYQYTAYYMVYNASSHSTTVDLAVNDASKITLALHGAAGILIPISRKVSLIFDVSSDYGMMNAGDGKKDVANFVWNGNYYFYGSGNYGTFNSYMFDAKLLLKLMGKSEHIPRN